MENKKSEKPYIIMGGTPDAMLVIPKDRFSIKIGRIHSIAAVMEKIDVVFEGGEVLRDEYDNKDYSAGFRTYITYGDGATSTYPVKCITEYDEIIKVLTEYGNPTKLGLGKEEENEQEHRIEKFKFSIAEAIGEEVLESLSSPFVYATKDDALKEAKRVFNKTHDDKNIIDCGTMHVISVYSNSDDANKPVFSETFMK